MMLTPEQEKLIHKSAVQFALEHYQDNPPTKGSVILSAAETFTESNPEFGSNQEVIDFFTLKVNRILKVLTDSSSRVMR